MIYFIPSLTGLEQELGRVGGGGKDHEAGARELRETEEAVTGEEQEWKVP